MALTDNLISYWKLDESSGNAADAHGSNTLTNNNTTPFVAAKLNNGADLESGSSQFFSITDASQSGLDLAGTTLSFSFWIKHESFYTSLGGGMSILSKDDSNQRQYTVSTRNNDGSGEARKIRFSVFSSLTTNARDEYETTTQISVDTWYHVVFTFNGASTGIIYLNGTSDYSQITSTFSGSIQDGTSRFELGSGGWGGQTYFDGIIDEVGIWSRDLTSAEVTQLYNSGTPLPYSSFAGGGTVVLPHPTLLTLNVG